MSPRRSRPRRLFRVDRLRRTCPGDSTPYGRLLETAGYSSAVVDVIAGTSAGGLNGALMASSVVDGRVFDEQVRNLWLQIGDLGKLLRPVFGRWPKSLLRNRGRCGWTWCSPALC